jgi:RNA polymerase sigma factor (sigma-70 family)
VPAWEAEDLVQEALLAALRQWGEIRDLEPWLVAVVRSGCRAYRARQARAWLVTLPDEELERAAAPIRPGQLGREAVLDFRRLLRQLPPRHRRVLWWRRGLGYSAKEVSRSLGCTPETARQLTRRAVVGLSPHRYFR